MTHRPDYLPECTASIRGTCLAEAEGGAACAVEDGECIYASTTPPGYDGPSVTEATADDRRWDLGKAGE